MTAEEKNKDTKLVIIEAANELFAKNGFGGTSVRDIAKAADVNLAAINYHFKNKENLYWRVFDHNYDWMKAGIEKLGEKEGDTAQLAVDTFWFFMESGSGIMNCFKIFLSDNLGHEEAELAPDAEDRFGPPGQHVFLAKLKKDLGDEIPEDSLYWAMKMTFSLLVHFGVVLNTGMMKKRCQQDESLSPEKIEKSIYHTVRSHLAYLKINPKLE